MNTPRVIVEISGGVCTAVYADQPITIEVLDYDNIKSGGMDDAEHAASLELVADTQKMKAYL